MLYRIVRVAVKNFMTYHVAEVRPGARMNLILGPNGSGKSSLVCAIVLALGGSPAVRSGCVGTMAHRALASVRCWWERLSRCELGCGRCLGARKTTRDTSSVAARRLRARFVPCLAQVARARTKCPLWMPNGRCWDGRRQIELYQPSFDRFNTVITVTMYHNKPHTAQYTFDGVARRKEYVQDQLRQMGIDGAWGVNLGRVHGTRLLTHTSLTYRSLELVQRAAARTNG